MTKTKEIATPIKDYTKVIKWENKINSLVKKGKYNYKHLAYFTLGLGTGLQPGILQNLKWEDIKTKESDGEKYQYITIKSSLIIKTKEIPFSEKASQILAKLRESKPNDIYVFQSEKPTLNKIAPWSLSYIGSFLSESAKDSGIIEDGTHVWNLTLRKTYGYFMVTIDKWTIRDLQREFEMRTQELTRQYIGLTDEEVELGKSTRHRIPRKSIERD